MEQARITASETTPERPAASLQNRNDWQVGVALCIGATIGHRGVPRTRLR
jgi:hypothetical protein